MNIKTAAKTLTLTALCCASIGLSTFTGGCTATATRESTGEFVDDAAMTARIKAAFVKDDLVKALDVKVETFKGVAQLSGFVNTAAEKVQAGRVAAAVPGVTDVKNNISVK